MTRYDFREARGVILSNVEPTPIFANAMFGQFVI